MAYDGRILRRAQEKYDEDRARHEAETQRRREAIFLRQPRLRDIDRELKATMAKIIRSALLRGTDPSGPIEVLRDENLNLQKERSALLRAMGLPEDALEEKPLCPLCGDSGYRPGGEVCRCLREYYAREQRKELSRLLDLGSQSFESFSLDWYSEEERPELGISDRENMDRTLRTCRRFAENFTPGRSGNLLLFGAPGLGKTFLSACIARVVSEDGYSVVYDTASHIFSLLEDAKFRRGDEDDEETRRLDQCDLLIIDDLGTEMNSTFVQSALYQLINGRLLGMKSTIISTNLTPEDIGRRYSQQVYSRIEGEYTILPFIGTDIRQLKRQRGEK